MVRYGERFFTSLGFAPLPETFWERSLFTKPRDREVVCHASAWDVDWRGRPAHQDVHRDHGRGLRRPSTTSSATTSTSAPTTSSRRSSATAPTTASTRRSATPSRSRSRPSTSCKLGLHREGARSVRATSACCCNQALDKVAFLPFGLLIDQWRWKVFSGEVTPEKYNEAWWELRQKYQGVVAPVPRSESRLRPRRQVPRAGQRPLHALLPGDDPAVPVPPRAVRRPPAAQGPLHRCSIYGNKEAGKRLNAMLEMGSEPAVARGARGAHRAAADGRRRAMLDYFAPLKKWLDEQNAGHACGW